MPVLTVADSVTFASPNDVGLPGEFATKEFSARLSRSPCVRLHIGVGEHFGQASYVGVVSSVLHNVEGRFYYLRHDSADLSGCETTDCYAGSELTRLRLCCCHLVAASRERDR